MNDVFSPIRAVLACLRGPRRLLWGGGAGLALLLWAFMGPGAWAAPLGQEPTCDWTGQQFTDFYDPPPLGEFSSERLGEILRVEHLNSYTPEALAEKMRRPSSDYGAEVYRILYLSQAPQGEPRAVSAMLIVPTGQAPPGGFPIISHGRGTVGMADQCAPSSRAALGENGLMPWVAEGFVVVASDYVGLGTPGLHPYGVGEATAFSMLDATRAALDFCDAAHGVSQPPAANAVVLEGHSQGGHSALFAQQLWPSYAPELNVEGAVVYAPGAEPRYLLQQMALRNLSSRIAPFAMALYAFKEYYQLDTQLSTWLKEPYASQLPNRVESQCVAGLSLWTGLQAEKVFQPFLLDNIVAENWNDLEPLTSKVDENTPGRLASDAPTLVIQGQADQTIPVGTSTRLAQRLCENGSTVALKPYPGVTHAGIVRIGFDDALAWVRSTMAGEPPPNDCLPREEAWQAAPVVLTGADLPLLVGEPIQELFVYAHKGSGLEQAPFQVDERDSAGNYVATEDGLFDLNDELVFMVQDLGEPFTQPFQPDKVLPIDANWYELQATNPADNAQNRWAAVVRSRVLARTFVADYVQYNRRENRIAGATYQISADLSPTLLRTLSVNGSADLLDVVTLQEACQTGCPDAPLVAAEEGAAPLIDGPLRAIARGGAIKAYASKLEWSLPFSPTADAGSSVRLSIDYTAAADGAVYMNQNTAEGGVSVDGYPDTVPDIPFSDWWQVTTEDATLVHVLRSQGGQGTLRNYYRDDKNFDPGSPGDNRHFGESGVIIDNPTGPGVLQLDLYLLAHSQPNLGEIFGPISRDGLQIQVTQHGPDQPGGEGNAEQLYLPHVIR